MSRFYASIHGSRGPATRIGTGKSGIEGHVRGWRVGVLVEGRVKRDTGEDCFDIYMTSGSGGQHPSTLLGSVTFGTDGPIFTLATP